MRGWTLDPKLRKTMKDFPFISNDLETTSLEATNEFNIYISDMVSRWSLMVS